MAAKASQWTMPIAPPDDGAAAMPAASAKIVETGVGKAAGFPLRGDLRRTLDGGKS